ncbi:MAG: thioesterase family protein [Pseudomonadales bacterium]
MSDKEKPFCLLLRVRYSECDAQQVVFNSRYMDYVDVAMTEFTRQLWGDYNALVASGYDNQVVSATIDWNAPAHFDDVLAIYVAPGRLGNTSYTLHCTIVNYASRVELVNVKITYVLLNAKQMKKTSIPDAMRASLEQGAPGFIIDQAGIGQLA